jgi:thymidylate synthase
MEIIEKTAEKAWKKLLKYVLENGANFKDVNGRICKEALNVVTVVENPENIAKPIEILNSFNKWIYPPIEEIKDSILGKKDIGGYYYNYGARAFNYNGVNQIDDYIIPLLKKDPGQRRAIIVFYGPEKDAMLLKKETPGMIMMNFNIREKKLHATMVIRSNDLFYGWPANIIQGYFLADYISKELNCPIGKITTISISAHVFEDQFEYIRKIIAMK